MKFGTDEGRLIEQWSVDGGEYVMRTARWRDLASYGAMHRELYKEQVMASPRNADTRVAGEELGGRLTDMACGTGVLDYPGATDSQGFSR